MNGFNYSFTLYRFQDNFAQESVLMALWHLCCDVNFIWCNIIDMIGVNILSLVCW